jgi:hypothetical protein
VSSPFRATFPVQEIRPPILQRPKTLIPVSETMVFLIHTILALFT